MIAFPAGAKVWIAGGVTDMRCGMNSLALKVQQGLGRDPHGGEIFCFRGRKGDLIKILWHDGVGMSLYLKRLEAGKFIWPVPSAPTSSGGRSRRPGSWSTARKMMGTTGGLGGAPPTGGAEAARAGAPAGAGAFCGSVPKRSTAQAMIKWELKMPVIAIQ